MPRTVLVIVVIAIFRLNAVAAQPPSTTTDFNEGRIDKLLAAIPSLDHRDKKITSFEICGQLPSPLLPSRPIRARVGWSRQHGTAMLLSSNKNNTPLIWAAGDQALVYDVDAAVIAIIKGVHPQVIFKIVGDEVRYQYGLGASNDLHLVEPRSFISGYGPSWTINRRYESETISATSKSGNSSISIRFRLDPDLKFESFVVQTNDKRRMTLHSIDSITINTPLSPLLSSFPGSFLERSDLPIAHLTAVEEDERSSITAIVTRALLLPSLLEEETPPRKALAEFPYSEEEWKEMRSRFQALAPKLRRLLAEAETTKSKRDEKEAPLKKR